MPKSCMLASESEDLDFEVRQVHHYSHRVLFTVEGEESSGAVHILRIYHDARRPLGPEDIDLL